MESGKLEAARQLSSQADKLADWRTVGQEGFSEGRKVGSSEDRLVNDSSLSEISHRQQNDKNSSRFTVHSSPDNSLPSYPHTLLPSNNNSLNEISSKPLNDNDLSPLNNHTSISPYLRPSDIPPSPQPSPSRGEGACNDSPSTLQPFNPSTDNSLPSCHPAFCSSDKDLSPYSPIALSPLNNHTSIPPYLQPSLYLQADATNLPFADNTFDIVTIGFGLRNIENFDGALNEIYRVLKKDGQFLHLDFGEKNLLNKMFDKITPNLVRFFTKNNEAYSYLIKSKQEFFKPNELIKIFEDIGFKLLKRKDYFFGAISCQKMSK